MTDWKALEAKYYMHVVNRQPVVLQRGQGARVWDVDGKRFFDCHVCGGVYNLGHRHPDATEALDRDPGAGNRAAEPPSCSRTTRCSLTGQPRYLSS